MAADDPRRVVDPAARRGPAMRLAVVAAGDEAPRAAAALSVAGVVVLAGEADDVHCEVARRHGVAPEALAPPLHIGPDLWFRMRKVAREADLEHRRWALLDPVVPHLLGVWRYVVPDLRVLVVVPDAPADARWPVTVSAYVAAHRQDCHVVPAADLGHLDLGHLDLTSLPAGTDLELPAVQAPAAGDSEVALLAAEVRHLRARLATAEAQTRAARPGRAGKRPGGGR